MPLVRFPVSIPDVWAPPVSMPASVLVPRGGAAARGCQARHIDDEDIDNVGARHLRWARPCLAARKVVVGIPNS